jgi:hypothetical protein
MLTARRTCIFIAVLALLTPAPATAGGWWAYVDTKRSTVAAGQAVKVRTQVMFRSIEAAQKAEEDGRFYVYALRGVDDAMVLRAMNKPFREGWWSLGNARAIELSPLSLRVTSGNLAWARASFVVPDDLAPGTYDLMLCDTGCTNALADVIPTSGFTVAADRATARVAARADRLEAQIFRMRERLQDHRRAVRAAAARAERAREEAQGDMEALEERLRLVSLAMAAEQSRRPPDPSPWTLAGWLLGGMFLGALAALLVRRLAQPQRSAVPAWEPSDEELRKLLSSERTPV